MPTYEPLNGDWQTALRELYSEAIGREMIMRHDSLLSMLPREQTPMDVETSVCPLCCAETGYVGTPEFVKCGVCGISALR